MQGEGSGAEVFTMSCITIPDGYEKSQHILNDCSVEVSRDRLLTANFLTHTCPGAGAESLLAFLLQTDPTLTATS